MWPFLIFFGLTMTHAHQTFIHTRHHDKYTAERSSSSSFTYRGITYVESDEPSNISNIPITIASPTEQWNLDRIDQPVGLDGFYEPPAETGEGVDIYIIDTGVDSTHPTFTNRVLSGYDAIKGVDMSTPTDCHGHGTHVASTAAGVGYGVATKATIIPVIVLACTGSGNLMNLIRAVAWVESSIVARSPRKAIVNLSIQAQGDETLDLLMKNLYDAGATVVVAAANFNDDACLFSPARSPYVITVGGTIPGDGKLDISNTGKCVNVYAPGESIRGAAPGGGYVYKRGTSMASPLVAGVMATVKGANSVPNTPITQCTPGSTCLIGLPMLQIGSVSTFQLRVTKPNRRRFFKWFPHECMTIQFTLRSKEIVFLGLSPFGGQGRKKIGTFTQKINIHKGNTLEMNPKGIFLDGREILGTASTSFYYSLTSTKQTIFRFRRECQA